MKTPLLSIWQELTPEKIFHDVESVLQAELSGLCLKRNSYINRVYELEGKDNKERLIVKFYRPGRWTPAQIREEHRFLETLQEKENPVIPPIKINGETLFGKAFPFALFPKKGGRAIDEFAKEEWKMIGRMIGRMHNFGVLQKGSLRLVWKPSIVTRKHQEVINNSSFLLSDFQLSFNNAVEMLIKKAEPLFQEQDFILLHGDLHKGNFLHRPGEGIYIVDFDDMCVGHPVQDLWMLLPDTFENSQKELNFLLEGYELFRPFDRRALDLIPSLQGMRIIHYAAWLAVQCGEPDFPANFPDSGSARYWNLLIKDLQEIIYSEKR